MNDYNRVKEAVVKFLRLLKAESAMSMAEEFIQLAEARIYRNLRVPALEKVVDLTTDATGGFVTLPSNYLEPKALVLLDGDDSAPLEIRPFEEVMSCPPNENGDPRFYCRVDNMFFFRPVPDEVKNLRLHYYMQLANLSEDNPTNYVSENAPDVLIFGALQEATPYLPVERIPESLISQYSQIWEMRFQRAMAELEVMADSDYNGSRLVMRSRD